MSSGPITLSLVPSPADAQDGSSPVISAAWYVLANHLLELRAAEVVDDIAVGAIALALEGVGRSVDSPAQGARSEVEALMRRVESRVPVPVAGVSTLGLSTEETLATVGRLVWRRALLSVFAGTTEVSSSLQQLAETHIVTIMPAYLGGQPVQPTTLAHFLGGVIEPLSDARQRLRESFSNLNRSPQGSGLLTGDVVGADRGDLAIRLGFDNPMPNTLAALGEVGDILTMIEATAAVLAALSRFVRELRQWVRTDPTSFVLDEEWHQYPEASHPALSLGLRLDALSLELDATLDRLDAARLQLRRLDYGPIGAGHDLVTAQGVQLPQLVHPSLSELKVLFETGIVVNRAYLGNRAGRFHTTAPDLAAFLMTEENLPPAMARQIAVLVIARVKDMRLEVSGITPDMIDSAALMTIGRELKVEMETLGRFLAPRRYIERRQVTGSAAPEMTRDWLATSAERITADRDWVDQVRGQLERAESNIRASIESAAAISTDG
jgi:argininosuccinate lyase